MQRIDILLLERGIVPTRHRAEMLIKEYGVLVNGKLIKKTGKKFDPDAVIELIEDPLKWVSRGAIKLEAALHHWSVDVKGLTCLDVGACTGGFSEVLLSRGAQKIYAVDTGTGQLADSLRESGAIVNLEKTNIRDLSSSRIDSVDICVVDVSFVSLKLIIPFLPKFLKPGASIITLIKPQFEVGKEGINKKGLVANPRVYPEILTAIRQSSLDAGFKVEEIIDSPIKGGDGNHEYLMYAHYANS